MSLADVVERLEVLRLRRAAANAKRRRIERTMVKQRRVEALPVATGIVDRRKLRRAKRDADGDGDALEASRYIAERSEADLEADAAFADRLRQLCSGMNRDWFRRIRFGKTPSSTKRR